MFLQALEFNKPDGFRKKTFADRGHTESAMLERAPGGCGEQSTGGAGKGVK